MDWKEKIFKGMQLIKEGCTENTMWTECYKCPFTDFCDIFEENNREHVFHVNLPSEWFKEEEEEEA